MNTQDRVKQINLDLMTDLKEYNSAMINGAMSIAISLIFGLTACAAIWYRLDAIKTVVGL